MQREYRFKNSTFIIMLGFLAVFIFMTAVYIKDRKILFLIINLIIVLGGIFHMIPYLFSMRNIVDDEGLKEITNFYGRFIIKELRWDEIGHIVDDYVSPILFYPPYKLHIFHVMPKNNIVKKFKRISISPGIQNYQELLFQVVSRVGPEVQVDRYVYEFIGKYQEKQEGNRGRC